MHIKIQNEPKLAYEWKLKFGFLFLFRGGPWSRRPAFQVRVAGPPNGLFRLKRYAFLSRGTDYLNGFSLQATCTCFLFHKIRLKRIGRVRVPYIVN